MEDTKKKEITLRVGKGGQGDIDPGIVRISPADMVRLGFKSGDVVALKGLRKTFGRLVPDESGTVKSYELQMDGNIRENAGVSIGELVNIERTKHQPAHSITLEPSLNTRTILQKNEKRFFARILGKFRKLGEERIDSTAVMHSLSKLLEGVPLNRSDRLRVNLSGLPLEFRVAATVPQGPVTLERMSVIKIDDRSAINSGDTIISYEDIGGLEKEITKVREMIELPLRYPEVFRRLGIEPPKGVLLYGPPGSGKTMIARAVANEAAAHFISISGPEVIQHGYGESEAMLRRIFREAQDYPASIVFFDEIDAIAPSRETVLGDVEKRVVAQLLGLMDGLMSRGKIIVIAATNLPNLIDPALRRPGRFDREIELSPPDRSGRLEILHIHMRGIPLSEDVDMKRLAASTHGFLGADLAALCREAVMLCVHDLMPELSFADTNCLAMKETNDIRVQMKHFEQAKNEIELSTTRQVFTEIPNVKWDEVGGLEEVKQVLREAVEWPLKYAERFEYMRTSAPKGVLLTGRSGTGKTLMAKALAAESGVNFIAVKGPELLSKWVGESERGIREIFKKARQVAPVILFFDELDAIVPRRGQGGGGAHVSERMVGQFLLEMDNIDETRGLIVLGATNRPDLIDPAVLRSGRYDLKVELSVPDYHARRAILEVHCRSRKLGIDVSLDSLAELTKGMNGAELESLCHRAAIFSISDSIKREIGKEFKPFSIESCHFEAALESLSSVEFGCRKAKMVDLHS